jgi:hypothetical protein
MPMTPEKDNGWSQYEKLVLKTLEELRVDVKEMKREIGDQRSDILMLKIKSSFWGAISGLGAYAVLWAAEYLKRTP